MAFVALTDSEVDAKSPIDDALTTKIQENFDDLDARVIAGGTSPIRFVLSGDLSYLNGRKRSVGEGHVLAESLFTGARALLKKSGTSGTLAFDIRKHTSPKTPITAISHQYSAATDTIAQTGSALSTQTVARATSQISTQSITHAKAAKNVQSIINIGIDENGNAQDLWQYNLDSTVDSDTVVGDSITFASCTNAANDGTFTIVDKNRSGGFNVVVSNVSGVAQTGAAGTAQIKIMSYNFTNPVDTLFAAGYSHAFASHTNAANDGTLPVYAINQSGNNIWVKNSAGVVQAGVAGTANTNFWTFALSAPASATDYIVGESAKTTSHTSGANNAGALEIIAVNSGSNNLILYNTAGVAQGAAAGSINTNRWTYALPTDPSAQVSVGQTVYLTGHTNALNDGTFTVKEVNRASANNLVVYNESGVAQGSANGNVYHTRKLVKFLTDQSAVYTTDSYIEMQGTEDESYRYADARAPFRVLEVNRGGGSNFNVVIDNPTGAEQASNCGYVQLEAKSVFSSAPSIAAVVTALEPDQNLSTSTTSLVAEAIPANTPIMLYITEYMEGNPEDLTVSIG